MEEKIGICKGVLSGISLQRIEKIKFLDNLKIW